VTLIFLSGLENAAAVNVAEQLITRAVKELLVGQIVLPSSRQCWRAFSAPLRQLILQPYNVTVN
jgi:hypothetical protein